MQVYFEESFEKDLKRVKDRKILKRVKETIETIRMPRVYVRLQISKS